ncbi:MFS transporter [Luteococcus sediminum]
MRVPDLYRRLFWPVYAPSILFGVAAGSTVPVQVLAAMHLGASAALAALVVAVVGLVQLVTTVHSGRLIDRLGDRPAMLLATVVAGALELGSVAALLWDGHGALALFIATSLLRAPVVNIWSLARQAFTAERVSAHEVGRAMTGLGGTMRIGNLIGPLLGGVLLVWWPLWSVYLLSVSCAALALVVLYIPALGGQLEAPALRPNSDQGPVTVSAPGPSPAAPGRRQPLGVDWSRVVLAGMAITCLQVARASQPVVVQLWGVHIGMPSSHISLVVALGAAVEVVLMFPGGYLKDRLGRAIILVTCLVVYGLGFLLMVPLTHWVGVPGMVLAVVVMALGNGLGAGVNMTIGADLSPAVGRARFLGVWALFSNVGGLGGPLLISGLVKTASVPAAVAAVGVVAVAGAVWMASTASRVALPAGVRRSSDG